MVSVSPFDWGGYLTLAEALSSQIGDEAALRSAISRAYYAALGRAVGLLTNEGRTVSPFKTHSVVWRAFKQSSDPRRVVVGTNLDRLRWLRERADYGSVFEDDLREAVHEAIERATRVLQTLDDLRSEPP